MAGRTKERVVFAARELFNTEGEQNVAMVDIALAMDISPGNLYYHYPGKEQLIHVLMELFVQEVDEVLVAPIEKLDTFNDYWAYLYLLLEVIHKNRFIYSNLSDIGQRDKTLSRRISQVISHKRKAINTLCTKLHEQGHINLDNDMKMALVDEVVLMLTYWFNFAALQNTKEELQQHSQIIHDGVYRLLMIFSPYMYGQQKFKEQCRLLHQSHNPNKK